MNEVAALAMTVGSMKIRMLFDEVAQPTGKGASEARPADRTPEPATATDSPAKTTRFT